MKKSGAWLTVISFLTVIILWAGSWLIIVNSRLAEWSQRGTFGDMFGAVGALFSGLAFAGLIIAIYLQSKELALQRQELVETREELRGQKEQLQAQTNELIYQRNLSLLPRLSGTFLSGLSFELRNIGSGTAVHISIDDMATSHDNSLVIIRFSPLLFLEPIAKAPAERDNTKFNFDSTSRLQLEFPQDVPQEVESEAKHLTPMVVLSKASDNTQIELVLRFQVIDGRKYRQKLVMFCRNNRIWPITIGVPEEDSD